MYDARAFCFRSPCSEHMYTLILHMFDLVYPVRKLWIVDHHRAIYCSCVATPRKGGHILYLLSDMQCSSMNRREKITHE